MLSIRAFIGICIILLLIGAVGLAAKHLGIVIFVGFLIVAAVLGIRYRNSERNKV